MAISNDWQEIGARIKLARESYLGVGMQQQVLAKKLGYVTSTRLHHYEVGNRKTPANDLNRIAEILGVSTAYLLTGAESPVIAVNVATKADRQISQPYRVAIPWYKGAMLGDGLEETFESDDGDMYEVPSWVVTSEPEKHCALTPTGLSMYPRIEPGSLVIVRFEVNPSPGSLICAMSPEGAKYIKGYMVNTKEKRIELHSINPEFGPITKMPGWVVIGVVVLIKKPYTGPGEPNMEWNEGGALKF